MKYQVGKAAGKTGTELFLQRILRQLPQSPKNRQSGGIKGS
jgi:hypothetical protein